MRFLPVFLLLPAIVDAQSPPLRDFLMPRDAEVALARSAAPPSITSRATIKVLSESGYQIVREGDNGFVCMVMRGWSAPTFTPVQFRALVYDAHVRAPICFNPAAARTVVPLQELRAKLAMAGKTPEQIADGVQAAYARGEIPHMDGVAFAYMWSAHMHLGPGIGAYRPHIMVYTPYAVNAMLGGNDFGGNAPFVSDDAGTPFAVTVIPLDTTLAIRSP
jgi:hypothetical protein